MSEQSWFSGKHQSSFPIILSDAERERQEKKKRKAQLEAEQKVNQSPASYGVYIPNISTWAKEEADKSAEVERQAEREYQAEHAPIREFKKNRFIPKASWKTCTTCGRSPDTSPKDCPDTKHAEWYKMRLARKRRSK
jgi:hypothetical protein